MKLANTAPRRTSFANVVTGLFVFSLAVLLPYSSTVNTARVESQPIEIVRPSDNVSDILSLDLKTFLQQNTYGEFLRRRLLRAAICTAERQGHIARRLIDGLGGVNIVSLPVRHLLPEFVARISEKVNRKKYTSLSQMHDLSRGRLNLQSAKDIPVLLERMNQFYGDHVVEEIGLRLPYPRWHLTVRDPVSGLVHEWQIGMIKTTRLLETPSVRIPAGVQIAGRPDFHDVWYVRLSRIEKKDPKMWEKYKLAEFKNDYDRLLSDTAKMGMIDFENRYQVLNEHVSTILAEMEQKDPGYFGSLAKGTPYTRKEELERKAKELESTVEVLGDKHGMPC